MPTRKQDESFASEMEGCVDKTVIAASALDVSIDWISSNLEPDDVFSEKDLINWAERNGFIKENS